MGEVSVVLTDYIRALSVAWLLLLSALAVFGGIAICALIFRFMAWLVHIVRSSEARRIWNVVEGKFDEATITITNRTAAELDLTNDDVVEFRPALPDRPIIEGTLNRRRPHKDQFTDNTIELSRDLYRQYRNALGGVGEDREQDVSGTLRAEGGTPFWNHPNRAKRYNNRVTVWVTAWTTLLTTVVAIGIEFISGAMR